MDAATTTRSPDRPASLRPPPPRGDERAAAVSLLGLVQSLLHEVPGLISDRVELLSLELGRAGEALAKIVALTVAVAILGITAWAALWVGVVMGLLALDWHWALALGVVIVANVGAIVWAAFQMRRLAGLLKLPATRRHLTMRASVQAVAAQSLPVATAAAENDHAVEETEHHASRAAPAHP